MKCPNCGAEIGKNEKFCGFCGTQVSLQMKKEQEELNKAGCPKCKSSNITFNREKQVEMVGIAGTKIVYSTVGFCKDCGYTWSTSGSTSQNININSNVTSASNVRTATNVTTSIPEAKKNIGKKNSNVWWWIVFAIMAVNALTNEEFSGGARFIIGMIALICFPPFINMLKKKEINFTTKARIWTVVILLFIAAMMSEM